MLEQVFSPAQIPGYFAFVFGVMCFAQTDDRRFRLFMSVECFSYVLHFALLGQPTAVASSLVSLGRSVASIYWRSRATALVFLGANGLLGWWLFDGWLSLLPIAASCIGTTALFFLQGVRMRALMLVGTACWIANNLLAGSIGGTLLELAVAGVNGWTLCKLLRAGSPSTGSQ
ncbi:MAG: YgjV family protein [Paucibacter sp.]|nr:YgjV family protein [Roseateles sp.]